MHFCMSVSPQGYIGVRRNYLSFFLEQLTQKKQQIEVHLFNNDGEALGQGDYNNHQCLVLSRNESLLQWLL